MTSKFFQPSIPHIPAGYPFPWPRKAKPKEDFLLSTESKFKGLAKLRFGLKRYISYVKFHWVSAVWFSLALQATWTSVDTVRAGHRGRESSSPGVWQHFWNFWLPIFTFTHIREMLHSDAVPFVSKLDPSILFHLKLLYTDQSYCLL